MEANIIHRPMLVFHWILGMVVAIQSVGAVYASVSVGQEEPHHLGVALLAGTEALAAACFLVPRFVRVSGWILIVIFLIAFFAHLLSNDLQLHLLVYAAGVLLVVSYSRSLQRRPSATGAFRRA